MRLKIVRSPDRRRSEPQSALQASTVGADFSLTVPGPAVIAASLLRPVSLCRRIPAKCVYTAANALTTRPSEPWTGHRWWRSDRPCRRARYDAFAYRYHDLDKFLDPNNVIADKGYQGLSLPPEEATQRKLTDDEKQVIRSDSPPPGGRTR